MKKVTLQDIATALSLSRNTVTKALNNGAVATETREEVIRKAKEMGYSKLTHSQLEFIHPKKEEDTKGSILVLFNRTTSTFWSKLLTGISDELKDNNYRMLLHIVEEGDLEGDGTFKLIAGDVKGIVLLCKFPLAFIQGIKKANRPMTFFDSPVEAASYLSFGSVMAIEGKYAVYRLVQKIIQMGYQTFAFIGHAENSFNMHARMEGMLQALRQNNIPENSQFINIQGEDHEFYSHGFIEKIIQNMAVVPEVFVCGNDDIAKLVYGVLLKRSVDLINKTVLVGFDNTIEGDLYHQDIWTVELNKEELGRRLIKVTIDKINYPNMDHAIITVATCPIFKS